MVLYDWVKSLFDKSVQPVPKPMKKSSGHQTIKQFSYIKKPKDWLKFLLISKPLQNFHNHRARTHLWTPLTPSEWLTSWIWKLYNYK